MKSPCKIALAALALTICFLGFCERASAQDVAILTEQELTKVVPNNFYFEGQLGPTQMRNAAAVRFQTNRHFVAALVDTSGYASNIQAKYEGFIIVDAPVTVGGAALKAGAYGFGFAGDSKMNIMDLGGNQLHSVGARKDAELKNPRPLALTKTGNEIRLYKGRTYVPVVLK